MIAFDAFRFVHVLADAFPILSDPCLGLSSEYPWGMTIATAAILATFMLEWSLHKTFHRRLILEAEREDATEVDPEAQLAVASTGPSTRSVQSAERGSRLKVMENVVISYTFEAGIIFHSEHSVPLASVSDVAGVACFSNSCHLASMLVALQGHEA